MRKVKKKNIFTDCNSRIASITTDLNGIIISFNNAAEKILGYSALETLYQKNIITLHDPKEIAEFTEQKTGNSQNTAALFEAIVENVKKGNSVSVQYTFITKSKTPQPCMVIITPVYNKQLTHSGYLYLVHCLVDQNNVYKSSILNKPEGYSWALPIQEKKHKHHSGKAIDPIQEMSIGSSQASAHNLTSNENLSNTSFMYQKLNEEVIHFLENFNKVYSLMIKNKDEGQIRELTRYCKKVLTKLQVKQLEEELNKGLQMIAKESSNKNSIEDNIQKIDLICSQIIEELTEKANQA